MQQDTTLLDDVKSHFDHWRATRTKRGKIPDYLWDKVKLLIGRYSLTIITETLSLNTNQIRDHLDLCDAVNFVEVNSHSAMLTPTNNQSIVAINHDKTCSIELHRSNGGVLKIAEFPIESLHAIIAQLIG
jgi:hypothetical protein